MYRILILKIQSNSYNNCPDIFFGENLFKIRYSIVNL